VKEGKEKPRRVSKRLISYKNVEKTKKKEAGKTFLIKNGAADET
jgi:hypothetical protein